jgi:hypothetical protein
MSWAKFWFFKYKSFENVEKIEMFSSDINKQHLTFTKYSVALVHERTITAERPPIVDEISVNFYR